MNYELCQSKSPNFFLIFFLFFKIKDFIHLSSLKSLFFRVKVGLNFSYSIYFKTASFLKRVCLYINSNKKIESGGMR